jgi:hypothetical protein
LLWNACSLIRSSCLNLLIKQRRYKNIPRDFRFCLYCETVIEDEFHFVLICPLYSEIRRKFITSRFINNPALDTFYRLMSCDSTNVIRKLAIFVNYSLKKEKMFCQFYYLFDFPPGFIMFSHCEFIENEGSCISYILWNVY